MSRRSSNAGKSSTRPGVRGFLEALKGEGVRAAIVSGSHRTNVELALSVLDLGGYFELIVSGDDIKLRKPDPGPFLHAARMLGISPGDCLVFEDSRSGMAAAKAAGMRLVCVKSHPAIDASMCRRSIRDFTKLRLKDLED